MKSIFILTALCLTLLGQQVLAQPKDKTGASKDQGVEIAKDIIAGNLKAGNGNFTRNAINIGLDLFLKKNQPELAWDMLAKVYDDDQNIDDDQRWMLLSILVDAAEKINKKSKTALTLQKIESGLTTSNFKSEYRFVVLKRALKLAKERDQSQQFPLLFAYLEALVKNAQKGRLKYEDQELEVLWALNKIYGLDLKQASDKNLVSFYEREIKRYKIVKEYLIYLKSSGFTQDQKLDVAATITQTIINHESFNNARDLIALTEPFLFVETKDQEILGNQLVALGQLMPRDDYYLSTKKLEDLTEFFEKTSIKSTSAYAKFGSAMFLGNFYSESGRFEKADEQFKIALENIDYKGDQAVMGRGFRLMINSMQLKSLYARGNLNQVIQKTPPIYSELNWFFNEYLKKYPQVINAVGGFSMIVEIQTFLGNYKEATSLGERILAALEKGRREGYDVNPAIIIAAGQLSTAYEKAGNPKRAIELGDIKFTAELRADRIPIKTYIEWYMSDVYRENYAEAENSLKSIEKNSIFFARDSDVQGYKNFIQISRELIVDLKKSNGAQKQILLEKNCSNILDIYETQVPEIKATGNAKSYLDALGYAYSFAKCGGEKNYAGYIAKLYVNSLQELRADLSGKKAQLGVFTSTQSDTLKSFVNNFYEIGDYQAAQLTMRVLKENEFLDFLNTRADKDLTLSKIEYSELEKEFNFKKEQLTNDIQLLEATYKKAKDVKEQSLIQSAIDEKLGRLKIVSDNFKKSLKKSYVGSVAKKDLGIISLKPGDAQLDYVIEKSKITLYIYTDKVAKSYTFDIPREKLRAQVLELNIALAKKQTLKQTLISLLSKELMIDKINELKVGGIKTLKIRSDDLLPIIPLALLSSEQGRLGENFNLIFLGLGQNELKVDIGDSMSAFGVTKPSQQYSALPFVKEEIMSLQDMTLPKGRNINRKIYLDASFTKSALVSSFDKGESYLHIATHYSIPGSKNNAGQLLLGDGSAFSLNDMRNEIKKNNRVQLVTLSACDTGVINKSEGSSNLEGLSNVLNLKGAKAVMGTLWPISDEATALFMKLFYGLIFKGGYSPEEALRLTQSAFSRGSLSDIKDGRSMIDGNSQEFDSKLKKYTNPFYWAAFQLIGS